jgi:hypothetical protein
MNESVLFRDISSEAEEKTKGKLGNGRVIDTRSIGNLDAELLGLGEIYLIESDTVLADDLGSRGGCFEDLAVEIVLSTQEGIESVTISDVGEELVLIQRAPCLNNLPAGVL